MYTLVTQSFGRTYEYNRAILAILSFFSCERDYAAKVLLFTDNPHYFDNYLKDLPVEYVTLSQEKIKVMRGDIDFLHRMKIALIEEAFQISNSDLLYIDSDTFFLNTPTPYMQKLDANVSFMHLKEYQFEEIRNMPLPGGATFQAFVKLIESKTFLLSDHTEINVPTTFASWNAGVMMLHKTHKRFIKDVYILTDQFYPATENHASEQYAFSVMLQKETKLMACTSAVYHYWYRVKKQIIDLFLEERLNELWASKPLQEKLNQVKEWCEMLPTFLEKHELILKDNAIQSFNENKFKVGFRWSGRAILKGAATDLSFLKDVLYHTKRYLFK